MTFDSVYEMFNPLTDVRKQHFWEWFSGTSLNSKRWYTHSTGGGNSGASMYDAVNGGVRLRAENVDAHCSIALNFIQQFSPTSSSVIWVGERTSGNLECMWGLGDNSIWTNASDVALWENYGDGQTYLRGVSNDGGGSSASDSDVAVNVTLNCLKIDLSSSNLIYYYNGVSKITKTSDRPTTKLEPLFDSTNKSGSTRDAKATYCEAWNT